MSDLVLPCRFIMQAADLSYTFIPSPPIPPDPARLTMDFTFVERASRF